VYTHHLAYRFPAELPMRILWLFILVLFAGCSSSTWEGLFAPEGNAIRKLDLIEREAVRGRDVYASTASSAGAWRVRCAWDVIAAQGACALRTRTGADELVVSDEDGYVALVGEGMSESDATDGGALLVAKTCVNLSTGRRACVWTRDSAARIVAALHAGKPLRFSVRSLGLSRDIEPSSDGFAIAESAYAIEMRGMRWRQNQTMGGGGGGGSM
jgi:hypothetical protein